MMPPILFIFPLILLSSIALFLVQRTHLLMILLAAEAIILTLTLFVTLTHIACLQSNTFLIFLLLTLGAAEAALGLAIMVAMARSFGNDLLMTLSLNKC